MSQARERLPSWRLIRNPSWGRPADATGSTQSYRVAAALLEAAGKERAADLLRACDHRFEFALGKSDWTVYAPGWLFALNRDAFVELRELIVTYAPDIAAATTKLEVLSRVNAPVSIEHLERLWDANDPRDIDLPAEEA